MDILRSYEILTIADPRLSDEEIAQLIARLQEGMAGLGIEVSRVDNWGKRRFTYPIAKQREGTYVVFEVRGDPPAMKELGRQLKLNEAILRFATTCAPPRKPAASPSAPVAVTEEGH
ncbi:MAG: 30S ribosomal protein S6 [Candidatus Rokubacteria bacterium]|nr:30S ribosomal protein S6 [Candidatus Rokubacteria bacterium]